MVRRPGVQVPRSRRGVRRHGRRDVVFRKSRHEPEKEGAVSSAWGAPARDRPREGEGDVVAGADGGGDADVAEAAGGHDEDVVPAAVAVEVEARVRAEV